MVYKPYLAMNGKETWIGHWPRDEEDYNPKWPSVNWNDLIKAIDVTPSHPQGLYTIAFSGRIYPDTHKIGAVAHVTDAKTIRLVLFEYTKPGGQWYGLSFEEQVKLWYGLRRGTPEHIVGWSVRPSTQ